MPIPSYQYLDRYQNVGTRTYSSHAGYTEAKDEYRPDSANRRFVLVAYEMPRDQMIVYSADPPESLLETYVGPSQILFCIHPQVLETYPDDPYVRQTLSMSRRSRQIPVVPSSSTRTVYAEGHPHPHAIKVHFPFKVSRYTRKMRDEVLEQAINVSRELEAEINRLDDRFAFLREVIAVAHQNLQPKSSRGENWGYLIRDMVPFPPVAEERLLVPGFSLYGRNFFEPHAPLLLFELIGDCDPLCYVLDNIMLPIIRHWVDCFLHLGYLLEPHGQNVLLEIDEENRIRRIVHRDLSVGIDMRRRKEIGRPNHRLNHYNRMEHNAFHSITYDRFMGSHFFDRIVEACREKYPYLSKADFREPCREELKRILPDYADYFPETIWYFTEERDRYNKPLYADTGIAPQWRP